MRKTVLSTFGWWVEDGVKETPLHSAGVRLAVVVVVVKFTPALHFCYKLGRRLVGGEPLNSVG